MKSPILFLLLISSHLFAQKNKYQIQPSKVDLNPVFDNRVKQQVNPVLNPAPKEPVLEDNLEKYLVGREIISQTIDEQGNIIIKYDDGLSQKLSHGILLEVITPDGTVHKRQFQVALSYVNKVMPPKDISSDGILLWLNDHKKNQLDFITQTFGMSEQSFLSQENPAVKNAFLPDYTQSAIDARIKNDYLYERIQYRSRFIAMMLEAIVKKR